MAKHQRKAEAKLARRIKAWEDGAKTCACRDTGHEAHRPKPGSQKLH